MKKILRIGLVFMGLVGTWIFFHEVTHIALNGFRFIGACVLNCPLMNEAGIFENGFTPFGVFLTEPISPLAEDEGIAHIIGLYFSILFGFLVHRRVLK